MQIKDNIMAIENAEAFSKRNITKSGPQKMAKLRDEETVAHNAEKIMQSLEEKEIVKPEVETPVENNPSVEISKEVEQPKDKVELPYTSAEVLKRKKDMLGIDAYKTLIGNIKDLKSIQETSRRLKTNPVVPGNVNRERNVNGIDRVEEPVKEEKVDDNTFDFSILPGVTSEKSEEVPEEKKYDSTKLDEWLNKENGITTADPVLNEVTDLQSVRDNTAASLANQKEILARLRERIENNKALCEVKKKELREENMELTQELNDVLAEINKLTDVANQQEAFLGISQDESMGIGK